jgi:hypothetical protein
MFFNPGGLRMTAKRSTNLAAALACAVLLAGCGSSGSSTTGTTTTTSSTAAAQGTTSSGTTATTGTSTSASTPTPASSTAAPNPAVVAQYADVCKAIIKSAPTLSATVKAKVESICDKAAKGDEAGARAAAKEVCVEVINASPIPAVAKQKALAACKTT